MGAQPAPPPDRLFSSSGRAFAKASKKEQSQKTGEPGEVLVVAEVPIKYSQERTRGGPFPPLCAGTARDGPSPPPEESSDSREATPSPRTR